jgi:hypothetical protein
MGEILKRHADKLFATLGELERATTEAQRIGLYAKIHEVAFDLQALAKEAF